MSYLPVTAEGGDWVFIETVTISDQATVDMDLTGTHEAYVFHLDNVVPADDGERLELQVSVDAGVSYLSGASDYKSQHKGAESEEDATAYQQAFGAGTACPVSRQAGASTTGVGNDTNESLSGFVTFHNAKQTVNDVLITFEIVYLKAEAGFGPAQGKLNGHRGGGGLIANLDAVDAVRFKFRIGNLSAGRISLYGVLAVAPP